MVSTFHSLETAKRSLFTQTAALNTTGHNIANANTEGFSRQVVRMTASTPIDPYAFLRSTAPGQLGTGVEFNSIERIRESFLDTQFRSENSAFGSWTIQSDTLSKLEAIVNEPSETGLRTVMDNFYKSWSDLSKSPEDVTARKIVKETTVALTDAMNQMSRQLQNLNNDLGTNVEVKGSEIQTYLNSIVNLNSAITRIEGLGDNANDLRDQRDLMTDKLSKIININVNETEQGYNVSLGAQQLIQEGAIVATVNSEFLNTAYASGDLQGGEVHGMIVFREKFLSDYTKQLDNIANTLVNGEMKITLPKGSVIPNGVVITNQDGTTYAGSKTLTDDLPIIVKGMNGLHQLGYTMDGTINSGLPFFTAGTNVGGTITAGNITLNSAISDNPNLIATSLRTEGTTPNETVIKGNNNLALLFANVKETAMTSMDDGTRSATGGAFFNSMVGQLGVQAQEATRQTQNATVLTDQVETRRQSVSGVSLDEEMSNMIKFQHAYSAAARFMTTFDELLNKLINNTGMVGR
ncbi:flagellar hook-associated protein FlgK [Paenibacillus sp. IHBB 10380]|uniref:flagellar hook-associated protein FlgK n=1 Tax=Paenibacillus sp. IHBB 10380 TaxID=1566358 RepID=UPI0005CFE0E6|nr:flagellar hook-associated protein FlgK [Paenibacillus sp. IHBB 10380]AJS60376.1 flagellar hook protein FlgK [Paenibacillus sp. IHBB 10380]